MHSTIASKEVFVLDQGRTATGPTNKNVHAKAQNELESTRGAQRPPDYAEQSDGHDDVAVDVADAEVGVDVVVDE